MEDGVITISRAKATPETLTELGEYLVEGLLSSDTGNAEAWNSVISTYQSALDEPTADRFISELIDRTGGMV